jgi:cysteine desulfurase / selenocysteine lyase
MLKLEMIKELDIKKIRSDFPILDSEISGKPLVYLDSAATSQKPLSVIKRMEKFMREENSTVRRGVYNLSNFSTKAFDAVREQIRAFINAKESAEIIFTKGCTESINLVADCFARAFISEADEILISAIEHHANIVPWQLACEKTKASLKVIPVTDSGELDLESYEKLISSGKVKILAISHVSNSLGTINPIKQMIKKAHEHNVPVLVDAAQSVQHIKIDVQELDADFLVFSGHKIYGPTGIGVLYGKRKYLDSMPPYHGGGEMIDKVSFEKTTYAPLPFKFEAGTPPIIEVIGLGEAIKYIENIGLDLIEAYEKELLDYATMKAREIKGLKIIGEANHKASLISFVIEGVDSFDLGTFLNEHGIAIRIGHHCAQPVMESFGIIATARISMAFYNTKKDIDNFFIALNSVLEILR